MSLVFPAHRAVRVPSRPELLNDASWCTKPIVRMGSLGTAAAEIRKHDSNDISGGMVLLSDACKVLGVHPARSRRAGAVDL
eukprot:5377272-Amphidinium_carterae.1